MGKLKVAVFGAGYWAVMQIPSWQAAGAEVTAVWNRHADKAYAAAASFGIGQVYETPEELFENADFDIADIITSPDSHYPLVMMAAKYKKDVICQKPLALSFEESKKMVEACRAAGVWFAVHENFRYRNTWQNVKSVLDSGVLGKILYADMTMGTAILEYEPALAHIRHMGLYDMGPHIYDLSRFLFGDAETVYCAECGTHPGLDILDVMTSTIKMKSGMLLRCDLCRHKDPHAFICGEKGTLTFDQENYITVKTDGDTRRIERPTLERPAYITEQRWNYHGGEGILSIRKCIEGLMSSYLAGKKSVTDAQDYLKTTELYEKAIASSEQNAVMKLAL